jgi:hypothetical protein
MAQKDDLESLSRKARAHYVLMFKRYKTNTHRLIKHVNKLLEGGDADSLKSQRIYSLNGALAMNLDKMHEMLIRIRDLEHFGEDELDACFVIVQRNDDGTTEIADTELVSRARIHPKASPGSDSVN